MPGKYAGEICRGNMPGKYAGEICPGHMPGKYAGEIWQDSYILPTVQFSVSKEMVLNSLNSQLRFEWFIFS